MTDFHGFYELAPEQFVDEIQAAIADYKLVIAAIKSNHVINWMSTIQPLEEAAERLDKVWSMLNHLNAVANTPEIRKVYEQLLPIVTNFSIDVMQDEALYDIYTVINASEEFFSLTVAQQTVITNAIRDFKLSGVSLPEPQSTELRQATERLSELENNFANNVLDSTEDWTYHVAPDQHTLLDGVPEHTKELAKAKAISSKLDGWVLSLDFPCYAAIIKHAVNRDLREEFYMAQNTRASDHGDMAGKWDNTPLIAEILKTRQKIAHLTGYANFAEYSLVPKMAHSPAQVTEFLHEIAAKARPRALLEFAELQSFAQQQGFNDKLEAWDIGYYSEMLRKQRFDVSEDALRVYFPEPRVLTGLFKLARKLFAIEIEEVTGFPTWDDSIRMFKVVDQDNLLRGHFYIDLFTRDGKRGGAWMSECTCRMRFASDLLQTPVAYLNCNFAPGVGHQPALLSHAEVETLFHEFGHTLHHVLTKVDYYSVSGMNGVPWDAVELPSQFMENWAWEWQVMQDISENINSGEPLPRSEFDKLLASKNFQSALFLMRQLEYTMFDLRIHENSGEDANRTAHEVLEAVRKEISVVPTPASNRFENSFSHIFAGGYAAGYYSYLWAEVLSCDAYDKFKKAGLFDNDLGKAFLTHILEMGGSRPAMDLFVNFAGREPNVDALLKHHDIA
jgi:oligopeptidase A